MELVQYHSPFILSPGWVSIRRELKCDDDRADFISFDVVWIGSLHRRECPLCDLSDRCLKLLWEEIIGYFSGQEILGCKWTQIPDTIMYLESRAIWPAIYLMEIGIRSSFLRSEAHLAEYIDNTWRHRVKYNFLEKST